MLNFEVGNYWITRLEGFQKSTLVTRAGSSPLAQSLYVDIINKKRWDNTDNNYFSFNDQKDVNLEEIEGDGEIGKPLSA